MQEDRIWRIGNAYKIIQTFVANGPFVWPAMYFGRDLVEVEFDIRLLFRHDVTSANSSHSPVVKLDPFNTRQRLVEERFCIRHASGLSWRRRNCRLARKRSAASARLYGSMSRAKPTRGFAHHT
jgi:hypothetical protein